jgi:transposase-like protein
MKPNGDGGMLGGSGPVEADETFVGRKPGTEKRRGYAHKNAVLSLVERNGEVRSFHVPNVTAKTLKPYLQANISPDAHLMTDDAGQYRILGPEFAKHDVVCHSSGEYVRGEAHTNTAESFFSVFKRGMYGVYQHVSSHHLHRYTAEFDFRYNHRSKLKITDFQRATIALKGIAGKRLTYRRTN